jgi:hypothetical protein
MIRATLLLACWIAALAALSGCGSGRATAEPSSTTSTPASNSAEGPRAAVAADVKARPAPAVAADAPARVIEKTFDDIKFDIKPDAPFRRELITSDIEALAGQRIRIRGYILPTPQKRGIKQFVLVRDNQECCFGPGAALYDCVLVEMQPGKTAQFSIRPVAVEGKFSIDLLTGPDDKPLVIYRIAGESVQ